MNYDYSKGNLLKNPQNYQMSPFLGIKFLHEYTKSRKNILSTITTNTNIDELNQILQVKYPNIELNQDFSIDKIITENILVKNLQKIINSNYVLDDDIEILIKKFEIKKKIFIEYNTNFKENSQYCDNILNYMLLSIICLLYYEKLKNLKFFNVSLKINDLLCSKINIQYTTLEKKLLSYIITKELCLIDNLCVEMDVK
jgi:hypothetical protein